jgi:hypothetical protein
VIDLQRGNLPLASSTARTTSASLTPELRNAEVIAEKSKVSPCAAL